PRAAAGPQPGTGPAALATRPRPPAQRTPSLGPSQSPVDTTGSGPAHLSPTHHPCRPRNRPDYRCGTIKSLHDGACRVAGDPSTDRSEDNAPPGRSKGASPRLGVDPREPGAWTHSEGTILGTDGRKVL